MLRWTKSLMACENNRRNSARVVFNKSFRSMPAPVFLLCYFKNILYSRLLKTPWWVVHIKQSSKQSSGLPDRKCHYPAVTLKVYMGMCEQSVKNGSDARATAARPVKTQAPSVAAKLEVRECKLIKISHRLSGRRASTQGPRALLFT
ncbi:MAG: hypothetical protein ABI476_02730 [Oxalobacteraceae bacterium]